MNYQHIILLSTLGFAACAPAATNPAPSSQPSSGGSSPAPALPADYQAALAPLRPAGSDVSLVALSAEPSASAHANAALFYANTDAAGMTLLWGMSSCAGDVDAAHGEEVAQAMRDVLTRRVSGQDGELSIRFAPGATPALNQDGQTYVPLAYLFEQFIGVALAGASTTDAGSGWTADVLAEAWSAYLQVSERAPEYKQAVALHGWLARLSAAGHLPGFVAHAFRLPYDEEKTADARTWALANPLVVPRATLPDDLIRITGG